VRWGLRLCGDGYTLCWAGRANRFAPFHCSVGRILFRPGRDSDSFHFAGFLFKFWAIARRDCPVEAGRPWSFIGQ
jgi:hypothetical protein